MKIKIPEGIEVVIEGNKIAVRKGEQELCREFPVRILSISVEDRTIDLHSKLNNAKSRALLGTFRTHIKNMMMGLQEPFVYKLKVCSSHFPMSVKRLEDEIQIQNFLGEKKPKKVKIPKGVNVRIDGAEITVSSPNIELAGAVASRLEQATRLKKKDRRIFQDGIFIVSKAGKPI